jgi:HK97 family phage major capsid protein
MTDLKGQRAEALKAARDIVDGAKAAGRDLTADESAAVQDRLDHVTTLDSQLKGRALAQSVMSLGSADHDPDAEAGTAGAKSLGEHFAKHVGMDGLTRLKSIGGYTVSAPEYGAKAATDPQATTGSNYGALLTQVDQTIVRGNRPPAVVADLLGTGAIGPNNNAVTYFLEGALEGDLATVAEGGAKPQFHIGDPTPVTDSLKKIAGWFDITDEMATDLDFMVSEINQRGLYRLAMVEEAQLLNGAGTGSTVKGLLNRTGIQTETAVTSAADNAEAIFRAMTKVQTATGLTADGLVVNPADYQKLRLSKDANGQYFGGGFFLPPYGEAGGVQAISQPIWGLRTIVTAAVAAGTAVVANFNQAATVYRKGGVRVESTNSDAGKFTSNIITTRIEERVALAVRMPAAIVKVTLL